MSVEHLSEHLSVPEFLTTQHRDLVPEQEAVWYGTPAIRENARAFAREVFEDVRRVVGPMRLTSGFRTPTLNAVVGGQLRSRHLYGIAADCVPMEMSVREALFAIAHAIRRGELPHLDKAIDEFGGRWLHLQGALDGEPARLALSTVNGVQFATVV